MLTGMSKSKREILNQTAARHAALGLENYARIRALAEQIARGFCAYLSPGGPRCVFLVPPKGAFAPRDYGERAFTVRGGGHLPLGPIGFGLAVRVSDQDDFIRIAASIAKEGEEQVVRLAGGESFEFPPEPTEAALTAFYDHLYKHLLTWYEERIKFYEEGHYGGGEIGFEMIRAEDASPSADDSDSLPGAAPDY